MVREKIKDLNQISQQRIVAIGWDVGGWMGNKQGIAALSWVPGEKEIQWLGTPKSISLPRDAMLSPLRILSSLSAGSFDGSSLVMGVDAPLGYPLQFCQLVEEEAVTINCPAREIDNPLAYRETDRYIFRRFGKKPLSAVFDRLGNGSTVALTHVRHWCREGDWQLIPQMQEEPSGPVILEVYPALLKINNSELMEPLLKLLPSSIKPGTDACDAALCSLYALAYAARGAFNPLPPLVGPPPGLRAVKREGWIYHFPPAAFNHGDSTED